MLERIPPATPSQALKATEINKAFERALAVHGENVPTRIIRALMQQASDETLDTLYEFVKQI